MYEEILKSLERIEQNPQTGNAGQQQHISVTATLAKINIDLVREMGKLRQTIVDLDAQNDRLTKITTVLSIVATALAIIQVLPILRELF